MRPVDRSRLRPVERAVLRHVDAGVPSSEIAWRFRRTPRFVEQVRELATLPRSAPDEAPDLRLRPLERRVLKALEQGTDYAEIASRLRRSPAHVARVEQLADYKIRTGRAEN